MRNISYLIIVFILSILVFGCTSNQDSSTKQHYKFTGINAIEVRFSPEAPSSAEDYYYVNENVPVEVEVKNLGYNEIKNRDIKTKLVGVAATNDFSGKKGPISPDDDVMGIDPYGQSVPSYFDFGNLKYTRDLIENSYKTKIEADYQSGAKEIDGTPTFFLNDKKIQNPRSYDEFRSIIQQAGGAI